MGIEKYVDRGMLKWQPASFIIEQKDLLDEAYRNFYKKPKPILDDDQLEEFNIKITIWVGGFEEIYRGNIQCIDEINKKIKMIEDNGDFKIIYTDEIISVIVEE